MFKFEMPLGWTGSGKITIETYEFDMIEALKEFIEFQEEANWIGNWDEVPVEDEEGEEEEVAEEEVTE
jgi:U3 small nucleolar ribonucleoprotein component